MRGNDTKTEAMFCYISPEAMIPQDHPLRPIRKMVDQALAELSPEFDKMYSRIGRPSIPPEKLLKGLWLSKEHFSVDGTLLEAWASIKSFRPKSEKTPPPSETRNDEIDWRIIWSG